MYGAMVREVREKLGGRRQAQRGRLERVADDDRESAYIVAVE
jgi:hypothetical protein